MDRTPEQITLRELLQRNMERSEEVLSKARKIASLESNEQNEKTESPMPQGIRGELSATKSNLNEALAILQGVYNQLRERKEGEVKAAG